MGRKKTTGLFKKRGIWQIDKQIFGQRIRMSTGSRDLNEAELMLARYIENTRQSTLYGKRPQRLFREGVKRYLQEKSHKASIRDDKLWFATLDSFIGDLPLEGVHMGSLRTYIRHRQEQGVKNRTINAALAAVRHLLNLAAYEWMDENGLTWLAHPPKIRLLPETDKRRPYPLSWDEQDRLFSELPEHLRQMALFKVNTGCREQEVCQLRWEWEVQLSDNISVFIIPRHRVKNKEDRLVVLNHIAKQVIDAQQGIHSQFVFTLRGKPLTVINNSAWQRARKEVGLQQVRVHDLKHTFGRRLRAAGVSFEDRQDLLGHKSGRITTHYSAAEISNLIHAANKVCDPNKNNSPIMTMIRCNPETPPFPHREILGS